jgi:hypothetical protein
VIRRAFQRGGTSSFLDELRAEQKRAGVTSAIRNHDTPRLFERLVSTLSYQGISDRVARGFMERNGEIDWPQVSRSVRTDPCCGKSAVDRAHPELLTSCGLPAAPLRNGRLNQTAYSLYLFIRDIADGDVTGWIDGVLHDHRDDDVHARAGELVDAMCGVFGVSHKMLPMLLSRCFWPPTEPVNRYGSRQAQA